MHGGKVQARYRSVVMPPDLLRIGSGEVTISVLDAQSMTVKDDAIHILGSC